MTSGHWPHTVWKFAVTPSTYVSPLIPFYVTAPPVLSSVTATSASDLTVVRVRYTIVLTATVTLDATGHYPVGGVPDWWRDLNPCYRIYAQPAALGPYESPYGGGSGETNGLADGGFLMNPVPSANSGTHSTQAVAWQAEGNSEGMRRLTGPGTAQVVATLGFNYDSYLAGYAGLDTTTAFSTNTYMKVLFGSATSIT